MLRRDVHHVVHLAVVHQDIAGIKRLADDNAVYSMSEKPSEFTHRDVRGRQHSLIRIQAGPRIVVVLGQNIVLCPSRGKSKAHDEDNNG